MRALLVALMIAGVLLPAVAGAHTSIESYTSATASTGGNSAGPGERIVTGDASAKVEIHTTVGGGGGTSTAVVETSANGKVEKKIITQVHAPGGVATVRASASTKGTMATSTATTTIRTIPDRAPQEPLTLRVLSVVRSFLSNLLSFWRW